MRKSNIARASRNFRITCSSRFLYWERGCSKQKVNKDESFLKILRQNFKTLDYDTGEIKDVILKEVKISFHTIDMANNF